MVRGQLYRLCCRMVDRRLRRSWQAQGLLGADSATHARAHPGNMGAAGGSEARGAIAHAQVAGGQGGMVAPRALTTTTFTLAPRAMTRGRNERYSTVCGPLPVSSCKLWEWGKNSGAALAKSALN